MTQPSRRNRLRPAELVALSLALGIFTGFIVVMSSRDATAGLIAGLVAFIGSLVVIAMLVLAVRPKSDELRDIEELDSNPSDA